MKITYDAEVDALYIRLLEGKHECRTVRLSFTLGLKVWTNLRRSPSWTTRFRLN
jgi:uncharacterized protein YuzE